MKATHLKVRAVSLRGIVESQGDVKSLLHKTGDMVLVRRGRSRSLSMLCPCGCGEQIIVNLDNRIGPAWILYNKSNKFSLYPSVWRESGCESHFILWNNRVLWFDYDSWWEDREDFELDEKVITIFKISKTMHYRDLAEKLDEIPWEILLSCRRLVKRGLLIEKNGKDSYGIFDLKK